MLGASLRSEPEDVPRRILEIGIGEAFSLVSLAWTVEGQSRFHALAHPRGDHLSLPPLARFVAETPIDFQTAQLPFEPIPWGTESFDVIVVVDVLEHLPPTDVVAFIAQVRERLDPQGVAVITSPNLSALFRIASLVVGDGQIFDPPIALDTTGTYPHLRIYGRADLERIVAAAGLQLVDFSFLNALTREQVPILGSGPKDGLARALQRTVPRVFSRFATTWIAVARRGETVQPN